MCEGHQKHGVNSQCADRFADVETPSTEKITVEKTVSYEDERELLAHFEVTKIRVEQFEDVILGWLAEHPDMSSAQVHDWLKETYPETYEGKDPTVRHSGPADPS